MTKYAKQRSQLQQVVPRILTDKIETTPIGFAAVGKLGSRQDIAIEELGKGFIFKSPNGHRWRLLVSNSGAISGVDLDA